MFSYTDFEAGSRCFESTPLKLEEIDKKVPHPPPQKKGESALGLCHRLKLLPMDMFFIQQVSPTSLY